MTTITEEKRRSGGSGGSSPRVSTAAETQPAPATLVSGIIDADDRRGYLRTAGYLRSPGDIPLTLGQLTQFGLRKGDLIEGTARPGKTLLTVEVVNGLPAGQAGRRPRFEDLTPIYPNQRFRLEDGDPSPTARIIDLISPIGKGQRGLIVSPPKAGKTTVLKTIAHAIATAYPEVHLMLVLVGERPEEVTDLRRSVRGEVIASTFDQSPGDHVHAAELAIERAKRLAELGRDVVVMLDSLTRLGRAYNLAAPASSRTLSGGVAASALQPPRQFLGAARCLEEGGSVTILSTALIDTGSQLDNVLFEEFKGTGNMELRLRRDLAEKRIFPAIDPVPSGTRREDLLMSPDEHAAVVSLRRALAALDTQHAIELLLEKTTLPNELLLRQVQASR
jgi:transcription termination factor Rho